MRTFAWLGSFSAVLFMCGASPIEGSSIPDSVKGILTGLISGVIASVIGWAKNRDTKTGEMEKMEFKYMWPTMAIGALVGAIAGWTGKSPQTLLESLESSPIYAGIIVVAEMVWKAIWRNSVPMIREALKDVKEGASNPPPKQ